MKTLLLWLVLAPPALPEPSAALLPAAPSPASTPASTPDQSASANMGAPPLGGVVQHPARRPQHPEPLSTQALPLATPDEMEGFAEDDAMAAPRAHRVDGATASSHASRPGDGSATAAGKPEVVLRTATPEPEPRRLTFKRRPHPPERSAAFLFGYRTFAIRDALDRHQSWHVGSLEVSPLRRYVRMSLITEFGWEGGEAARRKDRADLMVVGKGGLGVQYPHWVTPFVEFQGGAGLARVELFERNELVFLYTLGVEAGAQWAVARWLYLHASVGWIRPVMRHPDRTVRYDRATFKVGFGF